MSELESTRASLRFFGDDLVPDELTIALGCLPTHADLKGQRVGYPAKSQRIAKRGSWRLQASDRVPGNLDVQITEIFAKLTDDLSVWKKLTEAYEADLFCGLFMKSGNDGVSISCSSMKLLSERGVEIGLDIYQADGDDDSDRH